MTKIISPSILAANFLRLEEEISIINEIPDIWYHLDIMDGHFVPNLTFGQPLIEQIKTIARHPLDAHLMVSNPDFYLKAFRELNIYNITFHIESLADPVSLLALARKDYQSVGISLRPGTSESVLTHEILSHIDLLLVMSVEPGFAGQKFIESTWKRISHFKNLKEKNNYRYAIQVDGGVSDKNAQQLFEAGADNLVTGSYLFRQKGKYLEAIQKLL
ncbi:MAG: ribulose-phosphate 3-epimerase [Bdellovibrionales bacterium GWA2_49_15]|nr:MAG: ribulose-phosphate 3-epimerase [Bdellovibrionales bacterium GWA2_49_15]